MMKFLQGIQSLSCIVIFGPVEKFNSKVLRNLLNLTDKEKGNFSFKSARLIDIEDTGDSSAILLLER